MWRIRKAVEDDAAELIAFMHALTEVPEIENHVLMGRGEFRYTIEEEREIIRKSQAQTNGIWMVAVAGEGTEQKIIANAMWRGFEKAATRHVANLGISVARTWRGQGVGRGLMEAMLDWAKANRELKRLELSVFARNTPAIRLYESLGFVHEGRRERALWRGGEYIDELLMGLWIGEEVNASTK